MKKKPSDLNLIRNAMAPLGDYTEAPFFNDKRKKGRRFKSWCYLKPKYVEQHIEDVKANLIEAFGRRFVSVTTRPDGWVPSHVHICVHVTD